MFSKRERESGARIYPASLCSLSSQKKKAALSYNFDCPPCRQLDPQLLKYKTHTGTHKSVRGGVILNAGLLFNPGHIDYSCQ